MGNVILVMYKFRTSNTAGVGVGYSVGRASLVTWFNAKVAALRDRDHIYGLIFHFLVLKALPFFSVESVGAPIPAFGRLYVVLVLVLL